MGVSRSIDIRLIVEVQCLSVFIDKFTSDFWQFKNEKGTFFSLPVEDNGEFDFQTFDNIERAYNILDQREKQKKYNSIDLWYPDFSESIGLSIDTLENTYSHSQLLKHYNLSFSPGSAKRLEGSNNRLTDFGYYLNQIIPKLTSIGCSICEVTCHDFDF